MHYVRCNNDAIDSSHSGLLGLIQKGTMVNGIEIYGAIHLLPKPSKGYQEA